MRALTSLSGPTVWLTSIVVRPGGSDWSTAVRDRPPSRTATTSHVMVTSAGSSPGFRRVRNSWNPERVVPSANRNVDDGPAVPTASEPPSTPISAAWAAGAASRTASAARTATPSLRDVVAKPVDDDVQRLTPAAFEVMRCSLDLDVGGVVAPGGSMHRPRLFEGDLGVAGGVHEEARDLHVGHSAGDLGVRRQARPRRQPAPVGHDPRQPEVAVVGDERVGEGEDRAHLAVVGVDR